MKKIYLISPPGKKNRTTNPVLKTNPGMTNIKFSLEAIYSMPNITLITLYKLFCNDFEVEIFDGERNKLPKTREFEKFDYLLFTGMTYQIDSARDIAAKFKNTQVKTIIGGVHASFNDESDYFDSEFKGELESEIHRLMKDMNNNDLKKIYKGEIMDEEKLLSPIPYYKYINRNEIFPVQLTRGCPYNCSFCIVSAGFGKKLRLRPISEVKTILDEITAIDPNPGIFFTDDNMFLNRDYSVKMLELLSNYNIRFMTHTDLDIGKDKEILDLMKKAGCYGVMAGIETTGLESLREASNFKMRQGNESIENIQKIQESGIGVIGSFVIGFDHDTNKIFEDIKKYISKTHLFEVCIKILTPFPGTALRERLIRENRMSESKFSSYTARELVFDQVNLREEEINEGIDKIINDYSSKENTLARIKYFKNQWIDQEK